MIRAMLLSMLAVSHLLASPDRLFENSFYDFQAQRTLSAEPSGGANYDECLQTCAHITAGDEESWYHEWRQLTTHVADTAQQALAQRDLLQAREAFFRASNYARTVGFFLSDPNDLRVAATSRLSRKLFAQGIALEPHSAQSIAIPFANTTLPGYLFYADTKSAPLLILQTGFDGTAEGLYFVIGRQAVQHGYHVLIFEGPGQGSALREQRLPFRPDWESVIQAVVDYAQALPLVRSDQMALLGYSFGGYLVPRALAFEHRLRCGVVNGGIIDFHTIAMGRSPSEFEQMLDEPQAAQHVDAILAQLMAGNPKLRWFMQHGMFAFQTDSPAAFLKKTRAYQLDELTAQISTELLVVDSENDADMAGQAKELFDRLQCPKDYLLFTTAEGAGQHCQVGAYEPSATKILAWLDQRLHPTKSSK